ncbi:MAG: hypothetical protein WCF18_18615 [Chthoniobacteraceae bacterium]
MKTRDLFPARMALTLVTLGMILPDGSAFAQTAAPAIAATAIAKVPILINKPGLYLLKKDLVFTPTIGATAQAITLAAGDVTLDLGGHAISSNAIIGDGLNTTVGIGLTPGSATHTTIRNGVLRNFNQGIRLEIIGSVSRVLIEDMFLSNSGTDGIRVQATSIEIRRCKIVDTGWNSIISGTSGISAFGEGTTRIVDNDISNSSYTEGYLGTGISTTSGIVERNRVRGTLAVPGVVGISCDGKSFALDNVISGFQTGIQATSAAVKYRGNTTFDCMTPFSGGTAVGTENN